MGRTSKTVGFRWKNDNVDLKPPLKQNIDVGFEV
jgi:hypothetical protein